ncbi:unnamed protein product [Haemonchus placei]|uniref:Ovule protein n=1 Tax=Haemonchus placei TaxID=6290 RepID=A0A0N4WU25_HAEPC|nr:unnamed protein product [Haemonchus placei]
MLFCVAIKYRNNLKKPSFQAKVAAILPMYQVFTGVKGLDISQSELIGQQNDIRASAASSTSTSSSIFPNVSVKRTRTKSPIIRRSPLFVEESSPTEALTSKDSSPHHCISTSQSIDVGVLSQPFCQIQAYDLTVRRTSTANSPCGRSSHHFNQISPSKSSSAPMHIVRTLNMKFFFWNMCIIHSLAHMRRFAHTCCIVHYFVLGDH